VTERVKLTQIEILKKQSFIFDLTSRADEMKCAGEILRRSVVVVRGCRMRGNMNRVMISNRVRSSLKMKMIVRCLSSNIMNARNVSERRKKEVAFSQEYKCAGCKMMLPPDYAIDHIVPIALGGHNGFRNLQALCSRCHKLKTQKDIADIRDTGHFKRNDSNAKSIQQQQQQQQHQPLKLLNKEQNAAVNFDVKKSARIVAGPGTGKTAVLTERVARIVRESHAQPRKILVLTFTNRAAHEMRERISNILTPSQAEEITMGTFHSVCLSILRSQIQHVEVEKSPSSLENNDSTFIRPYRRGFGVYDEADSLKVLRGILKELGWKGEEHSPRFYQTAITSAKNRGIVTASDYMRMEDSSNNILTVFIEVECSLSLSLYTHIYHIHTHTPKYSTKKRSEREIKSIMMICFGSQQLCFVVGVIYFNDIVLVGIISMLMSFKTRIHNNLILFVFFLYHVLLWGIKIKVFMVFVVVILKC